VSAGAVRERVSPCSITPLPKIEDVASVPIEQVLPMVIHLSALQAALAARLAVPPSLPESKTSDAYRLVTANELATILSFRLDRVYELARTRRIPSVRIGRTMRFDVEAVRRALAS
jgi:excisionase family DNA binding protein